MILAHRHGFLVRLAQTREDVIAAQRLRYRVFYEELDAVADDATRAAQLDHDSFDAVCDHLLVIQQDTFAAGYANLADGALVGTCRMLRQDVSASHGGFYSADEFDIAPLLARHRERRFVELGRSCVRDGFRDRPVAELMWQGIWNHVRLQGLDVMLGCASLPGTDINAHAKALSFLAQASPAPPEWHVSALPGKRVEMNRVLPADIDKRKILQDLPTLVKAYLRLGCYIGEGAVVDAQFNTTDILIVLPVSNIKPRYFGHYGAPDQRPTS
jgi:L-ornithine Nalpha-acyltransferase